MKKKNKIVLSLGPVLACSADHDTREFKVSITGPVGNEVLEAKLENLRKNIMICYHGEGIDETILEGDVE